MNYVPKKLSIFLFAILLTPTAASDYTELGPKVCVKDGCLIGLTETSRLGREFYSFLGIPFAKPPVNQLRFKPPERPDSWETLEAKRDGNICPQSIIYRGPEGPKGNEDCLYLNVYTPQIPDKRDAAESVDKPFPVIVLFHSGGFQFWSGTRNHFPPNYILDRDVVVVSANYRLNIFGFLTTEDEVSPGNYGLKDQRLVLQWVKENIAVFGGDPEIVTIQGHDAGAASVHFHMLSPSSKGLFHRAIAQSGNALAPWSLSLRGEGREHANFAGRYLNCPTNNSSVLIDCLRSKSVEDLLQCDAIFFVWNIDPIIPWKPVVEPEHEGAFLTARPVDLLQSGRFNDVPFLTGVTSHEGLFRVAGILAQDTILANWNALPIKSYASGLFIYHLEFEELKDTIVKLRKLYFGTEKVARSHKYKFINMFSDRHFYHPMAKAIEMQLEHQKNQIFVYKTSYQAPKGFSFAKFYSFDPNNDKDYKAVCHADDLVYLYPMENTFFNGMLHNDEGNAMIDRNLDLFINFATHGNPTPQGYDEVIWDPVKSKGIRYLSIVGPNQLQMSENEFYNNRIDFWEKLNLLRETSDDAEFLVHDEL